MVEHKQAPTGSGQRAHRRFRWRHRRVVPPVDPPPRVRLENGRIVIVQEKADFVCCTYRGCGALRPLAETLNSEPCAACGRV